MKASFCVTDPPHSPHRRRKRVKEKKSTKFFLCSFRIDVSYVCGMCIVSFFSFFSLYANFFPLGEKASVYITHEGESEKPKEERHGFRAWKILKFFLFSSLPPRPLQPPSGCEWWKVLRDLACGVRRWMVDAIVGWLSFHCYISSSICIYLFFCTNISLRSISGVYIARAQRET